jgi:predicted dehydrogenase
MEPVRCAVIGIGMIGREHASLLAGCTEAELVACCDPDAVAREATPLGVTVYADLAPTLDVEGLEAVFVCTPQALHRPVVVEALSRGLAVFCEKPIASTMQDADAMISAARATGRLLAIGHTLRFHPDYIALHDMVSGGAIGRVVHMAARWNAPDFEGRIISGRTTVPQEMMIHDIDVMRWLAGDVERVYAEGLAMPVVGPGPDAVVGTLRFRSGAIGVLDHNWIMASATGFESDHRLAVFGTDGSAFIDAREPPVVVYTKERPRLVRTSYYSSPRSVPNGALAAEDRYFLRMVRYGGDWPITLSDARAALACALALDDSVQSGAPVAIVDQG